jgi:hypothetical protein
LCASSAVNKTINERSLDSSAAARKDRSTQSSNPLCGNDADTWLSQERAIMTICPDNSYQGTGPTLQSVTALCTDHTIYSPGRLYSALLQQDGNFVVARGNQPTVPANVAWASGKLSNNGDPGAFVAYMQNDGNFVIDGPNDPNLPFYATNTAQGTFTDFFASLGDSGTFTINYGTPPAPARRFLATRSLSRLLRR